MLQFYTAGLHSMCDRTFYRRLNSPTATLEVPRTTNTSCHFVSMDWPFDSGDLFDELREYVGGRSMEFRPSLRPSRRRFDVQSAGRLWSLYLHESNLG